MSGRAAPTFLEKNTWRFSKTFSQMRQMGLEYLPIHEWLKFMVNVGVYMGISKNRGTPKMDGL